MCVLNLESGGTTVHISTSIFSLPYEKHSLGPSEYVVVLVEVWLGVLSLIWVCLGCRVEIGKLVVVGECTRYHSPRSIVDSELGDKTLS